MHELFLHPTRHRLLNRSASLYASAFLFLPRNKRASSTGPNVVRALRQIFRMTFFARQRSKLAAKQKLFLMES